MQNKKVIVFRKSQWFFSQLIWGNGAFGAPCARPRWVGSARTTIQRRLPWYESLPRLLHTSSRKRISGVCGKTISTVSSSDPEKAELAGTPIIHKRVVSLLVAMSWFHSRENSFRFLQWNVTTTRPLSNDTIEPVSSLISISTVWNRRCNRGQYCKIYQGRQSSCTLCAYIKGIVRVFNWLVFLGGIMHLKPTAGC
jgi:hypothetical protein